MGLLKLQKIDVLCENCPHLLHLGDLSIRQTLTILGCIMFYWNFDHFREWNDATAILASLENVAGFSRVICVTDRWRLLQVDTKRRWRNLR